MYRTIQQLPLIERLSRPEYTGENRCIPCTVVNVVIAVLVTVGVGLLSPPLAVTILVLALGSIYLRGYLVPGTPTLTKRYLPDRVLRWFDKGHSSVASLENLDVESVLADAGVVAVDERLDDLVLTEDFEDAWYERIEAMSVSDGETQVAELATLLDVDAETIELERRGDAVMAWIEDRYAGQWESKPAFVADVAADRVLAERYPRWDRLPLAHRSEILGSLRIFLERCPTCDGSVTLGQEVVESCCRSYDVVAASCNDCGARLFETEVDPEQLEQISP